MVVMEFLMPPVAALSIKLITFITELSYSDDIPT